MVRSAVDLDWDSKRGKRVLPMHVPYQTLGWLAGCLVASLTLAADNREPQPIADKDLVGWVRQKVQERLPTAEERRFDAIAWVTQLRTARTLAQKYQRPIFLFTMDGRINTGRC
jgi:hypothetical protein